MASSVSAGEGSTVAVIATGAMDWLSEGHLAVASREQVLHLRLNRPESRNAFSLALLTSLEQEVRGAWEGGHRAIVLSGEGPVFSAGGDIKFARQLLADPEQFDPVWEDLMATFGQVVVALHESPCLSVTALHGVAVGAGASLALATDLRVMSDQTSLMPVWMDKGAIPDGGGSYFLSRFLSPQRMFGLALRAEAVDATTALDLGLVDEVVSPDEVGFRAQALASEYAHRAGEALVALRRLADGATRNSLAEQVALETAELRELRKGASRRAALDMDR